MVLIVMFFLSNVLCCLLFLYVCIHLVKFRLLLGNSAYDMFPYCQFSSNQRGFWSRNFLFI